MSAPPRDFREWMRQTERKLQQAIRSGNAGAITALRREADKIREEIVESGADGRTPTAPIELVVQTAILNDPNGRPFARLIVDFPTVTLATDGTNLTVSHYELWGREETNWDGTPETEPAWEKIHEHTGSNFNTGHFTPGTTWRFRIRAMGTSTVLPGEWSQEMLVEMGTDTTPPPILPALALSQNLGVVVGAWNGLAANGAPMPADFSHIELAWGTDATPTVLDDRTLNRPGEFMFVGLDKDVPYYFRIRSVDYSGNVSAWSQTSSITVEWLVTDDISGLNTTIEQQTERIEEAERKAVDSAQDAVKAQERAEDAIAEAKAAQEDADEAAQDAAEVAAEAARLEAEAAAARAAADQSALEAEQARQEALEARNASKDAFEEIHTYMAGQGAVIHSETAPTGEDAHDGNVWIKDSTGEAYVWNNSLAQWVLADDPVLVAAAAEADQAQDDAVAAANAAVVAQETAKTRADEAIAAEADALAKERAATTAEAKAADADAAADAAEQALADAQFEVTDTRAALETTVGTQPIIRQTAAPTDTTALWIDDDNNAMVFIDSDPEDELPGEWVISPDVAVRAAVRDWVTAEQEAAEAQTKATQLRAEADVAAQEATDARAAATAARTAADNAKAASVQANADAQQALIDARAARTHATQSLQDVQAFAGTSGGVAYQEAQPENPPVNMLWIVPSSGISYVWDGTQWREVVNAAVAAATRAADTAADQARAAEAAAERATAQANAASITAQQASTEAGGLRGKATALDEAATTAEANATTAETNAASALTDAEAQLAVLDGMVPGVAYHGATAPASTDPNDVWVDDATGQAMVYDTIQTAWVPSNDPAINATARDVDAAYDHAAALDTVATQLRAEATEARTAATDADAAADAAEANAAQLQQAAEAAQASADALQQTAADKRSAATLAFRNVSGTIPDTGQVLIQDATPDASFQSPDNLWIVKATGEPRKWNGTAWVAETDPEIVAMAEDAARTQREAEAAVAAAEAEAAEAAQARADAAAAGQTAGGASSAAAAAQQRANEAQAEADAAKYDAGVAATDAAAAWRDANTAAQNAGSSSAAAQLAEENAEAAQTAAEEAQRIADEKVAAVEDRAISRGTDLVTNGTGYLETNYNFSESTYDPVHAPTGAVGSFVSTNGISGAIKSDEIMPVDSARVYLFRVQALQLNPNVPDSRFYAGLIPHDGAGYQIEPQHYFHDAASMTTLAQPLNPGDTQVFLTSGAGWANPNTHNYYVGIWNWVDDSGKVWEAGTYTRNIPVWTSISGDVVTLRDPYGGPAIPAGNPVSNNRPGGNYMYVAAGNAVAPVDSWETFAGFTKAGVHNSASGAATTQFPYGTAGVRTLFLFNYRTGTYPAGEDSHQAFAAISLSDATAAYEEAEAARARAEEAWKEADAAHKQAGAAEKTATGALEAATHTGLNLFSEDVPSGVAPKGTIWFQRDATGKIVGQWEQIDGTRPVIAADGEVITPGVDGSRWERRDIDSKVIANLDVGKLTGGYIDAGHINTSTLTIGGTTLGTKVNQFDATKSTVDTVTDASGNVLGSAVTGAVATATNATNATNATTATNVDGTVLAGTAIETDVPGANVTGTVANATNATNAGTATNVSGTVLNGATIETDVPATQVTGTLNTGNIPSLPQDKIDNLPTDLAAKLSQVTAATVGNSKTYQNVLQWNQSTGGTGGVFDPIVIDTPIEFTNKMCKIAISGYTYQGGAAEVAADVAFYAYTSPNFINTAQTSTGSAPVEITLMRKISTGTVSLVIRRTDGQPWNYPQITVPQALIGHTMPPDSWADGWTAGWYTDPTLYDTSVVPNNRDLNSTHERTNTWTRTGTTFIDGGNIYTDSISAGSIKVNELRTEILSAGSIDGMVITGALIQTHEAANVGLKFTSTGIVGYTNGELTTDINGVSNLLTGEVRTSPPGQPGIRMLDDSDWGNAVLFFTQDGSIDGNQAAIWLDRANGGIGIRGQHSSIREPPVMAGWGPLTVHSNLVLDPDYESQTVTLSAKTSSDFQIGSTGRVILTGAQVDVQPHVYQDVRLVTTSAHIRFNVDGAEKLVVGPNLVSQEIYNRTYSQSPDVVVTSSGTLGRSTSLEATKIITDRNWAEGEEWRQIKNLRPFIYYDRGNAERYAHLVESGEDDDAEFPVRLLGSSAEHAEEVMPLLARYGDDGLSGLNYDRISLAQQPWLLEIDERLDEKDRELSDIRQRMKEQQKQIEELRELVMAK